MKKIFSLIFVLSIFFTSCERVDFGDVNVNPHGSTEANIDNMLRGGLQRYPGLGGRIYLANTTLYAQYQSQVTYTSEQQYADTYGSWSSYFVYVLSNFDAVTKIENTTSSLTNVNYHAIAEIASVMVFKKVTDTYGDIPYAEALQGAGVNATPAYSKQEDVYKDLIARAKAARDSFDDSQRAVLASSDPIYAGNLDQWKKLANTLIMSIAIQMSNKDNAASGFAATAFKEAIADGNLMTTTADDAKFTPDPSNGVTNAFSGLRSADYRLSKELTDALKGSTGAGSLNPTSNTTNDDRRVYFSQVPANDGHPYGYDNNNAPSAANATRMSDAFIGSGADFTLYSAAYTNLLRAEAASAPLNWTSEDASAMLTNGITQSFAQFGSTAGAATYAAARVADMATAPGLAKQVINEEMWVALFPDGFTAWANQRRSGYPMLTPAINALNGGVIPTRVQYPSEASNSNTTNWENALNSLSPATDTNKSKPWFMN